MKQCPKCPNVHNKPGIYCCRKCANSRIWTDEDKIKKSQSAKKSDKVRESILITNKERNKKSLLVSKNLDKRSETCKERRSVKFNLGLLADASTIKKVLIERYGYSCMKCGISEWMNEPISLQLDHVNGLSNNNLPDNVRLLCPNCHSQTPTYGAKNKGNGRASLASGTN
jgi:5-methylcytosine-specific restriction endonuclease McrA